MNYNEIIGLLAIKTETVWNHDIPLEKLDGEKQLSMTLRCLLYVALQRERVKILKDLPYEEWEIREYVAKAAEDLKDEIVKFAGYCLIIKEAVNIPQSNFMTLFHNHIVDEFVYPEEDYEEFIIQMFEIYQTLEQTLKTENRIELIYGLLDMFSKEEINPLIGFIILLNEVS